jgi:hypothetical protein
MESNLNGEFARLKSEINVQIAELERKRNGGLETLTNYKRDLIRYD